MKFLVVLKHFGELTVLNEDLLIVVGLVVVSGELLSEATSGEVIQGRGLVTGHHVRVSGGR